MEKEITIEYTPNTETLTKVSKYLLLSLPFVKYIFVLFLFITFTNILTAVNVDFSDNNRWAASPFISILMFAAIWGFLYFISMRSVKKQILKNKKNLETQKIILSKELLTQEGQTYNVNYSWKDICKIKETKSWFLIYINKTSALPIIKAELKDNQYNELKALFNSLSIKKSLK